MFQPEDEMTDPLNPDMSGAFPFVSQGGIHEHQIFAPGLTKREWFAGLALGCLKEAPMDVTASRAVIIADALIKALDK